MVEAGGVEPPSEKPYNWKTTCLSRSLKVLLLALRNEQERARN